MKRLPVMVLTVGLLAGSIPALAHSASAQFTSYPHSKAAALARATALAASFPLPAGITWTGKAIMSASDHTINMSRPARGSHGAAGLQQFFRTHTPAGMAPGVVYGPSVVVYETSALTYTSAAMTYDVFGADVQLWLAINVSWAPARPADTLLPSGMTGVTVEVWPGQDLPDPAVPNFSHQIIHATGPAVQLLIHYLNGLPVDIPVPFGAGACTMPLFYGSNPRFTFRTPHHVVVFQYVAQCQVLNVSVDGKHRPALFPSRNPLDPTRLVMTQLLHLVP